MSFAYSKPQRFYQISYNAERAYVDEGVFFFLPKNYQQKPYYGGLHPLIFYGIQLPSDTTRN